MKKLIATGAALFLAAAAAPAFASDVTREDAAASTHAAAAKASKDERCACPMHARHEAPSAARAPSQQDGAVQAPAPEFTDRG